MVLGSYQLGDSDTEARHWLLADRWQQTLDVGLAFDVRQLLTSQPSELAAAAEILGADRAGFQRQLSTTDSAYATNWLNVHLA